MHVIFLLNIFLISEQMFYKILVRQTLSK